MKKIDFKQFPIDVFVDNVLVEVVVDSYPDGTTNYSIPELADFDISSMTHALVQVNTNVKLPKDGYLWELICIGQILGANGIMRRKLSVPYLPHARADRRFTGYHTCPLSLYIDVVNAWYEEIVTYNVHNPDAVEQELLWCNTTYTDLSMVECVEFVKDIIDIETSYDILIAPDKGARSSVLEVGGRYNKPVLSFNKVRTDKGIEFQAPAELDSVKGKRVLICDDICDGGGTFIGIANILHTCGVKEVGLYVTHGIFSKGVDVFKGKIDTIYTFNEVAS